MLGSERTFGLFSEWNISSIDKIKWQAKIQLNSWQTEFASGIKRMIDECKIEIT